MDNKITKTRLSDYLAYEWILMIIVAVIAIIGWELIYTMAGVRLSVGQTFKYYYDETVLSNNDAAFYNMLNFGKENSILSYDVIEITSEALTSDYNVLSVRMSVQEGDIIITDTAKGEEEGAQSRAEHILSNFPMYDLDSLYKDAKDYLSRFLKEGQTDPLVYENLDENKIKNHFIERMKNDNRFRKEEDRNSGIESEKKRIKTLCKDVSDFGYILNSSDDLFYKHTISEELGEKRYGIKADMLKNGTENVDNFFRNKTDGTSKGVVILVFNFLDDQPDLQFETISFVSMCVRNFSNILA